MKLARICLTGILTVATVSSFTLIASANVLTNYAEATASTSEASVYGMASGTAAQDWFWRDKVNYYVHGSGNYVNNHSQSNGGWFHVYTNQGPGTSINGNLGIQYVDSGETISDTNVSCGWYGTHVNIEVGVQGVVASDYAEMD